MPSVPTQIRVESCSWIELTALCSPMLPLLAFSTVHVASANTLAESKEVLLGATWLAGWSSAVLEVRLRGWFSVGRSVVGKRLPDPSMLSGGCVKIEVGCGP